jgi:hypothetical protein
VGSDLRTGCPTRGSSLTSVRTVPAMLVASYQIGVTRKTGQSQIKYHPGIMMTNNLPTILIIIIYDYY